MGEAEEIFVLGAICFFIGGIFCVCIVNIWVYPSVAESNAEFICDHTVGGDFELLSFEHEQGVLSEVSCSPVSESKVSWGDSE